MNQTKIKEMEKITNIRGYELAGISMLSSMVRYNGFPKELEDKTEFLEWGLLRFGYAAIAYKNGENGRKYYFGYISGYDYDEYGLPIGRCSFFTRHGYQFECTIGEDCIIGYNNNIRMPDLMIKKFSGDLAEVDTSIETAVKKTRVNPIPLANNGEVAKALESAMRDIEAGTTKIIMRKTTSAQELINPESKALETVSLTSPEDVTRIQYLSRLHDDLLKRVFNFYGHSLSGVNKMAQVNSDELKGYETYSMVVPNIMLEARQTMLKKCNEAFGVNWSCEFSEGWKHLLKNELASPEDKGEQTESEVDDNVDAE